MQRHFILMSYSPATGFTIFFPPTHQNASELRPLPGWGPAAWERSDSFTAKLFRAQEAKASGHNYKGT